MTKQQTTPKLTEFRAVQTGARVTVTEDEKGPRWDCSGCGHGRAEAGALEVAQAHAEHCAVLPMP
ncbi:hypothetical protein MUK60_10150 [Streptomyces sp. LRE541]|uniref:hypothetical protein n=1 Tax=Streptomyces sp. LRE541 TaxID=2931983 RepID=UPI00200F2B9F|nr:hypothetical protein [Streptomyces sp. LRE541]UPZ28146.1 hypothetical protein MUK60_10150 [Streptomyces sp. LRE541]